MDLANCYRCYLHASIAHVLHVSKCGSLGHGILDLFGNSSWSLCFGCHCSCIHDSAASLPRLYVLPLFVCFVSPPDHSHSSSLIYYSRLHLLRLVLFCLLIHCSIRGVIYSIVRAPAVFVSPRLLLLCSVLLRFVCLFTARFVGSFTRSCVGCFIPFFLFCVSLR